MSVRITCITKDNGNHDNPHEAISHFGWTNESTGESDIATRAEMVDFLDKQKGQAYVKNGTKLAYCYTRQGKHGRFVQTYSDNTPTNNLLELRECVR